MQQPFGKTIEDATEHYLAGLRVAAKIRTVSQVLAEFFEFKKKKSDRYQEDLKNRLTKSKDVFGEEIIATVSTPRIEEWLNVLGKGPVNRNNIRRVLTVLFKFAAARGYAHSNPMKETSIEA